MAATVVRDEDSSVSLYSKVRVVYSTRELECDIPRTPSTRANVAGAECECLNWGSDSAGVATVVTSWNWTRTCVRGGRGGWNIRGDNIVQILKWLDSTVELRVALHGAACASVGYGFTTRL